MKKNQFTIIELIIVILIISIVTSIVVIKILDMKNKSISAAVSNNTQILQTAVDKYALNNNGEYPIKDEMTVNLSNPRLIDLELLKKQGYLKKELDTSKVKNQYYWLDVFGVAWGSTENTVNDINFLTSHDSSGRLEFITPKGAASYRIYEVSGYSKLGNVTNKKEHHYKLLDEVKLNKKRQKINFIVPDSSKTYLISAVDKYEQETAPVGVFYKGPASFKPILSGEGVYEFEIDSFNEMFWIDFKKIEVTPGKSTIDYTFKVKDKKGEYMNWTNDYYSLPSSQSITVKVDMKSDSEGNKPSLYDINVMYRYAYEEKFPSPETELGLPNKTSDICPSGAKVSAVQNGKWLVGQPQQITYLVNLPDGKSIDTVRAPSLWPYSIINVQYEYANSEGKYVPAKGSFEIPAGSCVNIIYEVEDNKSGNYGPDTENSTGVGTGEVDFSEIPGIIHVALPEVVICENECVPICKDCIPCLVNCEIKGDKPEDSCQKNECIKPPTCNESDADCIPPVCTGNCLEGPPTTPSPKDATLNDPNWVTKETLRFFANGPAGMPTHWIGMIPEDEQDKIKTRIIYRYAKSNGYFWSGEIDEISKVGQSQSLMVVAYLQVHKDVKDDPNQIPPKVKSIRILHEKGEINLSMIQPTLTILPIKDNNEGREVFSNESLIDWEYVASDPRGRKITEIEWAGDKYEKYSPGTYKIEARVMNESQLWSEWAEYTFEILPEKPIAKITKNIDFIYLNKEVSWFATQSYDPDGDTIVKTEWRGDKQNSYSKTGTYTVGLRVQDEEGYWSEWVEESFKVTNEGIKIYRIEAEDLDTKKVSSTSIYKYLESSKYSGGKAVEMGYPAKVTFKFKGTGFDLKYINDNKSDMSISLNGVYPTSISKEGENIYSIRNLENKEHVVSVTTYVGISVVDYLDVYSDDDTPEILNVHSKQVDSNNIEQSHISNQLIASQKQKIRTHYTLHKNAYVSIRVYDSTEKEISILQENKFLEGGTIHDHHILWDGKDKDGNYLDSGIYHLKIRAVGVDRKGQIETSHTILINNEKSIYRLEAEDLDTKKVTTTRVYKYPESSEYSGGKTVEIGYAANVTFKFTGTGFDLKQFNNKKSNAKINLNGVTLSTISKEGENTYSIRNLENKAHIVSVTEYDGISLIDYLDVYSDDDAPEILNVHSRSVGSNNVEGTYSTDFIIPSLEQKGKVHYTLHKNAYVSIGVYNSTGVEINSLLNNKFLEGGTINSHNILWDGKDKLGNFVPTGTYQVKIKAVGVDRKGQIEKSHTLHVDHQKPSYRIEAEDTDTKKVTGSRLSVLKGDTYSGGKAVQLGYAASITFKFTGSGFDLKQINDHTNLTISIDGVKFTSLPKTGEQTISVRKLENKEHTVSINGIGSGYDQIDYLDIIN